jgi:hypothetical protein
MKQAASRASNGQKDNFTVLLAMVKININKILKD